MLILTFSIGRGDLRLFAFVPQERGLVPYASSHAPSPDSETGSDTLTDRFTEADTMEKAYLEQTRHREIDLVVVSDAEAILGIGGKSDFHNTG